MWHHGNSTERGRACGRRSGSAASQLAVDGLTAGGRPPFLRWKSYQQSVGRVGRSLWRAWVRPIFCQIDYFVVFENNKRSYIAQKPHDAPYHLKILKIFLCLFYMTVDNDSL